MDNHEEYILRVLHRTNAGLQDSLIPAHGAKLKRLVDTFDSSPSLAGEIAALMSVRGFGKCALAMEWLYERTRRTDDDFSPEQFESDVLLLNEKIFEAFLNQPFDMPDYGRAAGPAETVRPVNADVQMSADELQLSEGSTVSTPPPPTLTEPSWDTVTPIFSSLESELTAAPAIESETPSGNEPGLRDIFDAELTEIAGRVAESAALVIEKSAAERPVTVSVLRVSARAAMDAARAANNLVAQDFFGALVKFIGTADEMGKIRHDLFAESLRDVADRLAIALSQPDNGMVLLKNITAYLADPKELLGKK